MQRNRRNAGYSALELLLVVVMIGILAAFSLPHLISAMLRARANGAAEVLAATIRDARTRAVTYGWQYQVVAYDSTGGALANAFRIQGFDPATGGVAPAPGALTSPRFYGSNQMYEPYTPLAQQFGNAQIQVAGGTFQVTFNSRGEQGTQTGGPQACVPVTCVVQVSTPVRTATITVTAAGGVRVQ